MKRTWLILFAILALAVVVWSVYSLNTPSGEDKIPEVVSYNYHIRPILSDKCFVCHGPDKNQQKASLRLDIPEAAFAPLKETKGAFAIVRGKPEESELFKRISSQDPDYQMPTPDSHLGTLNEREIKLIEKWIRQGAKYEKHWAFIAPKKTALPEASDKKWVKNEIDYFTLQKMEEKGLSPNPEAEAKYLLKRAALDLTGLLPDLKMLDEFVQDKSNNAYEKYIDKLMASPQYGEKMAIHWLDVSRYSDSYGYQDDNVRSQWPYRDWLIHAFNKNIPYNQFITWQLAGDMLPNASKEQILATAFLRNHKYTEEGGIIPEEYRVEYLVDKVKTYTKGILALTAECAQCHDHKYDPISQKEYYQMFGFFNTSKEVGFEGDVSESKLAKNPILTLSKEEIGKFASFINHKDTTGLMVSVMGEQEDSLRKTYILGRGAYNQPKEWVRPEAFAQVLKFDTTKYSRNRLGLAKWTVSKDNPLTARVFVNQIWQEIFGKGLVKTTGDFGMQGNLPSHPELLDWLAVDFMENGWNIKRLVKQIMMSATYRQSAKISERQLKIDPENIFLSHAPRLRVKAEVVRDIVLGSAGLLNKEIGGPSVKPYQPKGLWEMATSGRGELATYRQDKGNLLYRRGMYTFIKLTLPPPSMMIFDASNRDQCEVKRLITNTPLQSLVMMNDPMVLEASRVFAQKLIAQNISLKEQLEKAFRAILCRLPNPKEMEILEKYYQEQLTLFKAKKLNVNQILNVGEYPLNTKIDLNASAAMMKVVNTIYNMEEAITKS
jgi:mono/diheme cytochrome c family protein